MSTCAACGKDGDNLNSCTACKLVKYCNATCQNAHRPKHKKECKKRAAEIFDEALFKQPPPKEDCPICFLRLPILGADTKYQTCCGKITCNGCEYAEFASQSTERLCPFCRTPGATLPERIVERLRKRIEAGDANAMDILGCRYSTGDGVPQDSNKALELWNQASKLGCARSHRELGDIYFNGEGVEMDFEKTNYHWELAAIGGNVAARCDLGKFEGNRGNINRAMKHFMISAGSGHDDSLKEIQNGFSHGHVTKDDFEKALRAHKESKDEMQSDQRDAARRFLNNNSLWGRPATRAG
ncbi:hypothetical protein ACHAXR_009372 [Thalassiosira sp. AJA248-18]